MTAPRLILVLGLALAGPLAAQSASGRISGTLSDPAGAVISGAEVTLTSEGTGERQVRRSNDAGVFLFASLPPGSYTIRAAAAGFAPKERKNIVLNADGSVSLGAIVLALGAVTDSVQVESSGTMVELDKSGQSQVVTNAQMRTLMAASRDVMSVMKILPGVSQQTFNQNQSIGGSISGSELNNFSGTRAKWNSVKLDGQPGQNLDQMNRFSIPIAWDAVEEVTVQPNSYLAEHGRSSGVHINVISKGGSNQFHGSGYVFRRHEQFNASNFFNNRDGLARPIGRYTSYGATAGGPIRRDRLFFFVSQENWRVTQAAPIQRTTLPSDLEKAGNFSQSVEQNGRLIPINDPTTRQSVPGNIIPASRLDRHGVAMLKIMPTPNSPSTYLAQGFNNIMQQRIEVPKTQTQFKIDWLPSSRDRVSVRPRWFGQDLRGQTGVCCSVNANFALQPHHYNFLNRSQAVTWTRTVTANLVNELSGGWFTSQEKGDLNERFDLSRYKRDNNGLGDLPQLFTEANALGLIPGMQFGGVPNSPSLTYDDRTPIRARDDRFNLQNQTNWLRGKHNIRLGIFYELQFASEGPRIGNSGDLGGRFLFNRDASNNPLDTNHPFSNAAYGVFREYRQANRYSNGAASMYLIEWYAQDSWKATRNLSLDYGLRLSHFTDYRLRNPDGAALDLGRYDRARAAQLYRPALNGNVRSAQHPVTGDFLPAVFIGAYAPGAGDRLNGIVAGGAPDLNNGFRANPPLQWQPRFGFAYDLAGKGRTVVRGGIGIYKQAIFSSGEGVINSNVVTAPPIVDAPNLFFGTIPSLRTVAGASFPTNEVFAFERDWRKIPTVYKWSFGIQQQLPGALLLDTAYVGNTGRHLRHSRQINTLPPGTRFLPSSNDPTTNRPLPDNFLRPLPGYTNVSLRAQDVGWSHYHSLQVSLNKRRSSALQYGIAYTWSKATGLSDEDSSGLPMFTNYRTYLYGKLPFDQTHMFIANYSYRLPEAPFARNHAVSRAILHGWQINGITTYASGFPSGVSFAFADGVDRTGGGDAPRVWMAANPILARDQRTFERWFNTASIRAPGRLEFGDAPQDVFRRPGIANFDATLSKDFKLTDRLGLQFRSEFYNIFNHTQFDGVDSAARFDAQGNQINARFGQITSARSARELQFSLRVHF
jgi:hypothetical protein